MLWASEMGDPWVVVALGMSALLQAQTWWLCHVVVRSQGGGLLVQVTTNVTAFSGTAFLNSAVYVAANELGP